MPPTKTCDECGAPMPPAGNLGAESRRRFCSTTCKSREAYRRRVRVQLFAARGVEPPEPYTGPCSECGGKIPVEIVEGPHGSRNRTCSRECALERRRRRARKRQAVERLAAKLGISYREANRRRIAERTHQRLVRVEGML